MKVLIVGINYKPEATGIAPYTTGLAEHLATRGDDVTVVTGLPSYPQWRVYDGYRHVLHQRELLGGVAVRRCWHYVPCKQSAVRRGLYETSFLVTGLSALALRRPDVILGVVPSLSGGLLVRLAARRFGMPYGLIFQDLVGPAAAQSGVTGGGRAFRVARAAEGWAARDAAAVGIIAEGFRPYLKSVGVEPGRIRRIRNWTHVEKATMERAEVRLQLGLAQGAMVCLHAGNMGYKQGLGNVIECARVAATSEPRLLFVLMGNGSQRAHLEDLAGRYQLPNLRFLPIQPAEVFPSVLAAADILLVNQRASVMEMALPGKLTSYFAAGRPVVAAVSANSETALEVDASGAGVVIPPDNPEKLLKTLHELAIDWELRQHMGRAGQAYAEDALSDTAALAGLESLVATLAEPVRITPKPGAT